MTDYENRTEKRKRKKKTVETVEEYLERGGKIHSVPPGESGYKVLTRKKRNQKEFRSKNLDI